MKQQPGVTRDITDHIRQHAIDRWLAAKIFIEKQTITSQKTCATFQSHEGIRQGSETLHKVFCDVIAL